MKNVLVIGGGGREHAIVYTLNKSDQVSEIYAIPGNPGIGEIAKCFSIDILDNEAIVNFVEEYHVDLTIVGPEVPLCNGLADALEAKGHLVFGPLQKGAMLEGSKAFSKDFMIRHNIPTAKYREVNSYDEAINALDLFEMPVVIKADGLAAGKGVVIAEDYNTAKEALYEMMVTQNLGTAGNKVVLEEFLQGFECSLLCFVDNETIIPMVSAKDHKQIYDGNLGPNTGGMGTISPNPFMPSGLDEIIEKEVLIPFMDGLKKDEIDYRGIIFIGLMIEDKSVKVLEFNVRFGDPETQSILLRLDSDLYELMNACATNTLKDVEILWKTQSSGCLVISSKGYPNAYPKGAQIKLEDMPEDVVVFHAGTKLTDGKLVSNGGRVLNICALGKNLDEVREKMYRAAEKLDFEDKYYRNDIGLN